MSNARYLTDAPARIAFDAMAGLTVLEFGTDWCRHCRAAQPHIAATIGTRPGWHHLKIEDGPGRALGRSYAVKLWPTLIFLREGREHARLVRPTDAEAIKDVLNRLEV